MEIVSIIRIKNVVVEFTILGHRKREPTKFYLKLEIRITVNLLGPKHFANLVDNLDVAEK